MGLYTFNDEANSNRRVPDANAPAAIRKSSSGDARTDVENPRIDFDVKCGSEEAGRWRAGIASGVLKLSSRTGEQWTAGENFDAFFSQLPNCPAA